MINNATNMARGAVIYTVLKSTNPQNVERVLKLQEQLNKSINVNAPVDKAIKQIINFINKNYDW